MRCGSKRLLTLLAFAVLPACGDGSGGIAPFAPPSFPAVDLRVNSNAVNSASFGLAHRVYMSLGRIYVTWTDNRNGNPDVFLRRSLDGGKTWAGTEIRLDTDLPGAGFSNAPRLWVDGLKLYAVWTDLRGGVSAIYFNRSSDGGVTWLPNDVRIDHGPGTGAAEHPTIVGSGSSLYVAWYDDRTGPAPDIYFNRSLDGGATWLASDRRLDTDTPGVGESRYHQLACDGARVYCAWEDDRDGNVDVRFNHSTDGGSTWQAADRRLDTDLPGAGGSSDVKLAVSGPNLYVLWMDMRNGPWDLYLNSSSDGGVTWRVSDVHVERHSAGAADSLSPDMVAEGLQVFVIWGDRRNGVASDIYFNASADGGSTWRAQDVRVDRDAPGAADSHTPRLVKEGTRLYTVWVEDRNGFWDAYFSASGDEGLTWLPQDVRLDRDLPGAAQSDYPNLAVENGRVCAVWEDHRAGNFGDLYFIASD